MTAKEIKDYLRTEEKILWEELMKADKEFEKRGYLESEKTKQASYISKLAHWATVWEINKDLNNTEE